MRLHLVYIHMYKNIQINLFEKRFLQVGIFTKNHRISCTFMNKLLQHKYLSASLNSLSA